MYAHRMVIRLAAMVAILAIGVITAIEIQEACAAPERRMRVAVMDFTNAAGGELDHLGKGLQSMLITDLAGIEAFELVERARLSDIRAEIALAQGGLIDKKTAVRIGKLAGATHLIAGSYTVAGDRMRLDARLFEVASGKVLLATKAEGERDAFFELEKDLARKLAKGTGVALAPRDRARLGKIHTADFQAFEKFSKGIDLFDARRYDEAMQALRQASSLDGEFELARLTLAEYERLVQQMRARADAAAVAETELARLREDTARARETAVVETLFALAARNEPRHRIDRQVALNYLLQIYTANFQGWAFLRRLQETGDAFAVARTRDRLYQSYWAGAVDLLGTLPPFTVYVGVPPTSPTPKGQLDEALAAARARMQKSARDFLDHQLAFSVARLARHLHLDRGQQADLLETLVRYGLAHGKDEGLKARWLKELAELGQDAFDLDRSSRYLARLGSMTRDARLLDKAAGMMEENRDMARLAQQRGPLQPYVRELLANSISRPRRHPIEKARKLFTGTALTVEMARAIDQVRKWYRDDYLLLADRPMWLLQGDDKVRTGPRQDRYRAGELRYFVPARTRADAGGVLGIWGGAPHDGFDVRFRAGYEAPRDFWLARGTQDQAELTGGGTTRPRVSFLFGLRNIDTPGTYDRASRQYRVVQPMTGYAVHIEPGAVVLARVREERRSASSRHYKELVSEEIQRLRLDPRGPGKRGAAGDATMDVSVEVKNGRVTVQVGGKRFTARLPGYESGYLGLKIDGHGYAAWQPLAGK
jgi:TolB-like protein